MTLLRRFPRLCFAMVLVAIVGFCTTEAAWELLVVAVAIAGLSWSITEGPRGRTLPSVVVNVLVIGVAAYTAYDLVESGRDVAPVLGRFCLWLLLVKLYDRRTARDHGQLMSLSLLLMLVGCARQPPPLAFGVLVLVYAVLGLYTLLLYQLYAAHERQLEAAAHGPAADRVRRRPAMGRRGAEHLRTLAVVLGATGIVLSTLFFLAFPRQLGRGFTLPTGLESQARRSGFSAEVNLVGGTRITPSSQVLGTLRVLDAAGRPVSREAPFYLRGAALDVYARQAWRSSAVSQIELEVEADTVTPLAAAIEPAIRAAPRRWEVRLRRPSDVVFVPDGALAIDVAASRRLLLEPQGLTLKVAQTSPMVREWDVWVDPEPDASIRRQLLRSVPARANVIGDWNPGLEEHPDAAMIREFARSILREAGLPPRGAGDGWPLRAAEALADRLRSPPFAYTLDMSDLRRSGRDPVTDFLLEHRRGHCEFFASALAVMCQTLDIPARVVAGFVVREWDPREQHHVLRAADAHAWVEVRVGPYAWVRIDPTPPAAVVARPAPDASIATTLGELLQTVEGTWSDRFVAYDQRSQSVLLERLDRGGLERVRAVGRRLRDAAASLNRAFRLGVAGYVWLAGVGVIALVTGAVVLRLGLRRRRIRRELGLSGGRGGGRMRVRDLEFYFDLLEVLRRHGFAKPASRSPLAHAEALAAGGGSPQVAEAVRSLVERYYELRFGGRAPEADEPRRRRREVAELAALLDEGRGIRSETAS